jgi:hypothetical protein
MKASDFRVGNLINHEKFGICQVITIYQNTYDASLDGERKLCFATKETQPIPLTEEWLLKFGFEKRGIYYHFPKHDIFKLEQYKLKNAYWLRYYTESIDCVRINSVHQLQNLYHALTGEELTHGK